MADYYMDISNFIVENWQTLLSVVLVILSFILALIKKKPFTLDTLDNILLQVDNYLPFLIQTAEERFEKGIDKKVFVMSESFKVIRGLLGRSLTSKEVDMFTATISERIENILSTPEKK